jgi:hypothetical protein
MLYQHARRCRVPVVGGQYGKLVCAVMIACQDVMLAGMLTQPPTLHTAALCVHPLGALQVEEDGQYGIRREWHSDAADILPDTKRLWAWCAATGVGLHTDQHAGSSAVGPGAPKTSDTCARPNCFLVHLQPCRSTSSGFRQRNSGTQPMAASRHRYSGAIASQTSC